MASGYDKHGDEVTPPREPMAKGTVRKGLMAFMIALCVGAGAALLVRWLLS